MDAELIKAISSALTSYRQAIANSADQEKEDYSRLAAITEKVLIAMRANDIAQVRLSVLGFSRQVSDSFSHQPTAFRELAERIAQVKKLVAY